MRNMLWVALLAGAAPGGATAADPAKLEREAKEAARAAAALRAESVGAEAARELAAREEAEAQARRAAAAAEEARLRDSLERALAGLAPARMGPTGAQAALAATLAEARVSAASTAETEAAQAALEQARAAEADRLLASLQEEARAFEARALARRQAAEAARRAKAERKAKAAKARTARAKAAKAPKSVASAARGSRKMAATQRIVDGGGPITRMFAEPTPGGTPSKGVSIAAASGATVRAPAAGRVVYAGPLDGFGRVLILEARDGYALVLGGLETLAVSTGASASEGQALGVTPSAPQAELYFEVRRAGVSVDPQHWLGSRSTK